MGTECADDIVDVLGRFKSALLRIPTELAEADNAESGRMIAVTGSDLLSKGKTFGRRDSECFPIDPYVVRPRVMSPTDLENIIREFEFLCGPGALASSYRAEVKKAFDEYRTAFPKVCPVADQKPDKAAAAVESLGVRLKDMNDLEVLGSVLNDQVYVDGVARGKHGGGLAFARSMRVLLRGAGNEKGSRNRWLGVKQSLLVDHDGLACTYGHWASHRAQNKAEKLRFQKGLAEARSQKTEFEPFYDFRINNQNGHDGDVRGYWTFFHIGNDAWHPGYGSGFRVARSKDDLSPGVGNLIEHLTFKEGTELDAVIDEMGGRSLGELWREVIEWEKVHDILFAGMRIGPYCQALGREGRFAEAFELADEMDEVRRSAEVVYSKDGDVEPLLVLEGRSCLLRSDLHTALAVSTCDPGNRSAAKDQLQRAKTISEGVDNNELSKMVSERIGRIGK
jgi:hypothetical protein